MQKAVEGCLADPTTRGSIFKNSIYRKHSQHTYIIYFISNLIQNILPLQNISMRSTTRPKRSVQNFKKVFGTHNVRKQKIS